MKIQLRSIPLRNILLLISSLFLTNVSNGQATFCLTYGVTITPTTMDVTLGIRADGSAFKLGTSNLQFRYKKAAIGTPTLVSNALAATGRYRGITVTQPTPPSFNAVGDALVSFNLDFTGIAGQGLEIATTGTNVAVIRFQILDAGISPNLRPYDNGTSGTVIFEDDQSTFVETTGGCPTYNPAIPIEWLGMSAYPTPNAKPQTVTIDWATASEYNNSHYIIERSTEKLSFEPIGRVQAANKASKYSFIDTNPIGTLLYYRIRQVDFDGTEELSKTNAVSLQKSSKLNVYPTLTNSFLTVEIEDPKDFTIFNLLGQQVLNGKAAQRIDVSALPQGAYFLRVGTEQVKFIKQ